MIISASRRTDIPSYYSEWFFNRLKEEFVLVRNPMNIHQIGRIDLSPTVVDGIVLWTKNPAPMIERISELEKYNYYFQFTLNAYGKDIEPNVPSKREFIIPIFKKLSQRIGREKIVWRYDPIFFNEKYTIEYHIKYFNYLASQLSDYTEQCTVSFLDLYRNTTRNMKPIGVQNEKEEKIYELMQKFSTIAKASGISLNTCAEKKEYDMLGIEHACCIDKTRIERIGKCKLAIGKDKNQRQECGCIESIDIGAYNTCSNGCYYCYANYSSKTVIKNSQAHNPLSPIIFGEITGEDVIKERKVRSCKEYQITIF